MILLTSDSESDFISHFIIGVDKHFMIIPLIIQTSIHIFVVFI